MPIEYCPQCGTARVGALRFCRSCGFDYDTLPQADLRPATVAEPVAPAPDPLVPPSAPIAVSAAGPASSRRGWFILGGVIFLAVIAAAAFIGLNSSGVLTPHHDVTGSFELIDTNSDFKAIKVDSVGCEGTSGYSDITPGTNVTIKDGEGKILATGSLGNGSGTDSDCRFSYTLKSVPEAPFYTIEVGRRGALNYSLADMRDRGWSVDMTLGS